MFNRTKADMSQAAPPVPQSAPQRQAYDPGEERTIYGGWRTDESGKTTRLATTAPHLLWLAGTGSGKTRRGLAVQTCIWDGCVVAVTMKSDLAELTADIRRQEHGGKNYIMDLTGQADWDKLPEDIIPVSNDPCLMLTPDEDGNTDDAALDLAELLTSVGSLGAGGSSGGGDSAFWMTLAHGTLAALLQAGAGYPDPETGEWVDGGGIAWVRQAALNPGIDEKDDEGDIVDEFELDLDTPSWDTAAARAELVGSAHVAEIESAKQLDPRQRDSIGVNLRVALSAWNRRTVRNAKAAVAFTPELLEKPYTSFYLISPSKGGAASAASAVIESLVEHWTRNAMTKKLPKIAMIIDECPSICPLPRLDEYIATMRSYGMHFMVAAQDVTMFASRFGEAKAKVLMNVFPAVMIGIGTNAKDLLEYAAWAQKPSERRAASSDDHGRENMSADLARAAEASELLPRSQGEGRLLLRGMAGPLVRLVDFSKMVA